MSVVGTTPLPRQIIGELARDTSVVFASTLTIQAVAFLVMAASGLLLATEDFARLSLVVASVMLSAALFELGLGLTMIKRFKDSGDEANLQTAFTVWLAVIPLAALLGFVVTRFGVLADIGLGIALGAAMNLWNGLRSSDQGREDYASIVRSGFAFAAVRLAVSAAVLYAAPGPVAIALALYAAPLLVMPLSRSFRYVANALTGDRRPVGELAGYAAHVYLNAVAFIATPYIPQFMIAAHGDPVEIGTYGLALTFTGPVSLLVYSLRSVLLPKMLGNGNAVEDLMWSRRGLAAIGAAWLLLMAGAVVLSFGLDIFYAHKFPEIRWAFLIFFTGFSATAMIGLYSLSVHTQGVPHLSMIINVVKLMLLAAVLVRWGGELLPTIAITTVAMVAGEVALIATLRRRRQRLRSQAAS